MSRTAVILLASVVFASCASTGTRVEGAPAATAVHSIQFRGTAFLRRGAPEHFRELEWLRVPSAQELARIYPDSLPGRAMAGLKCEVGKDGELTGCKLDQIEPRDPEMVRLVLRLGGMFRLAPRFVEQTGPLVEWITLDLSLENRRGKEIVPKPCLSPFCIRHYGAPPPAPPLSKTSPPERYQER